jgi:hypothetical protein
MAWRPVLTPIVAGLLLAWTRAMFPSLPLLAGFVVHFLAYTAFFILTWMVFPGGPGITRALVNDARSAFAGASA